MSRERGPRRSGSSSKANRDRRDASFERALAALPNVDAATKDATDRLIFDAAKRITHPKEAK